MKFSMYKILSSAIVMILITISTILFIAGTRKAPGILMLDIIVYTVAGYGFILSVVLIRWIRNGITKQKLTDKKFLSLLDAAPDASVIVNDQGIILMVNRQMQSRFGFAPDELVGQPIDVILPLQLQPSANHHFSAIIRGAGVRSMETPIELIAVKKNGDRVPVEIILSPIHTREGLVVSAFLRDLSDQKKVQEKLEFLYRQINQSNDAIYTLNADAKILTWNRGAEMLYGYTMEEAIGRDSNQLLKTELSSADIVSAKKLLDEKNYWSNELRRKTKSGRAIFVKLSLSTIRDNSGTVTGYVSVSLDITVEKKLSEQVGHLANIVEHITDSIVSIGVDERIISWNQGAEKLHGYTKEEAIGKTAASLGIIKIEREEIDNDLKDIMNVGIWKSEMEFYHRDGSSFYGAVTVNLLKNSQGETTSLVFIVNDISARKNLEDQLKLHNEELEEKVRNRTEQLSNNEKRFRALIENNYDIISLLDESFCVFYRSPSALRITGWTDEEIIGFNGQKLIHPDDSERTSNIVRQLMARAGEPIYCLFRSLHKNGNYLWLEGVVTNLLADDQVKAIVFNFRDVTQRVDAEAKLVKSEKLYRSLFENMINGFAYCEAILEEGKLIDYTYLAVNEEYQLLTGIMGIPGRKMSEVFPELLGSGSKYIEVVSKVVLSGMPEKFEIYSESRHSWYMVSIYSPENGYFVCLVDNITDRKLVEQKIQKLNAELEERVTTRTEQLRKINEELEAFTYSVSHDLRAPLRAIIGFATILEEDYASKLDNEARRITDTIKNNTLKMGHLIDDLLAFSRTGKQEIVKMHFQAMDMVDEVIAEMTNDQSSNNRYTWKIHPLPTINADRNIFRQVFVNLISNAVKYSGKSPHPQIEIGSYSITDYLVFFVKDNGVGFNELYKDKLFKVFQRLHGANEFEGTGVGLALVEKIVSRHGGKVWAEGKVDEGSCFYFSLPV